MFKISKNLYTLVYTNLVFYCRKYFLAKISEVLSTEKATYTQSYPQFDYACVIKLVIISKSKFPISNQCQSKNVKFGICYLKFGFGLTLEIGNLTFRSSIMISSPAIYHLRPINLLPQHHSRHLVGKS
ncbi:MAG: hypothetical protein A3J93_05040 [Candidatus Magasanikbacteria bacterium RIFOXYC2_FULL_42_28]|uniref:Uncharacterized protein n=1 Tax=Candidatus Magasanikbacteria bacterium RIFOXYC2_FULL_42_28 TaxID=1798704 RepID=A0A1F6NUZ6_9BACT|nr:MAG: hypothetical protein A3J93_05040 [Candidatus Magasanikbacteria bacterium RIFOXYC2_FULL_42_28]